MSEEKKKVEKVKEEGFGCEFEMASPANSINQNAGLALSEASREEWNSSFVASSMETTSRRKESDQNPVAEQGIHHPPTRCYGYDRIYVYPKRKEMVYSEPALNSPNSSGSTLRRQSLKPASKASRKELSSTDYTSSVSSSLTTASRIKQSDQKPDELKGYDRIYRKHHYQAYSRPALKFSNSSRPLQNQKVPPQSSDFQSTGFLKGCSPMKKCSSYSNQRIEPNNPMGYNENESLKSRDKLNRNGDFQACHETSRGPRSRGGGASVSLSLPAEKDLFRLTVQRDKYNLQTFQIKYEDAKFFVIKSYSEEDIHKSIKYDVWASTANGNKKLNAVFHDAGRKSSKTGINCPIFLFFSVNGSGQFVGLAEMLGQVDFKKDMDFWQLDKWNGFFPLKWQIIKDIPNGRLRHIILENNDNKPVTHSRDTQEIGFKQGLEMLDIFKSCTAKTSMLDDYSFYEDNEKSLHASIKDATLDVMTYEDEFQQNHFDAGVTKPEASITTRKTSYPKTSLITLARNLSLNPNVKKASDRKSSLEGFSI